MRRDNKTPRLLSILLIILFTFTGNSCLNDYEPSTQEYERYNISGVKSYAELFELFWRIIDDNNTFSFYEQERRDGKSWEDIYREYYPKFKALKTFRDSDEFPDELYREENKKVKQYFTEIMDPMMDTGVKFEFELPNSFDDEEVVYFGNMKKNEYLLNFYKQIRMPYTYVLPFLENDRFFINDDFKKGRLLRNKEIYYFQIQKFYINNYRISLLEKYFEPLPKKDTYFVNEEIILNNEYYKNIKSEALKEKLKETSLRMLSNWSEVFKSEDINKFNDFVKEFNETETMSYEFMNLTVELNEKLKSNDFISLYNEIYLDKEAYNYLIWFVGNLQHYYNVLDFYDAYIYIFGRGEMYVDFLNPLHNGEIKKLVIDLRNSQSSVFLEDIHFFVSRLITKDAVIGYQKSREGGGQNSFTPWVPIHIKKHQYGVPKNIPIVILTDGLTEGVAEILIMALKAQGNHAVVIGNQTKGNPSHQLNMYDKSKFNGGYNISPDRNLFGLNVPAYAIKDADGKLVSGNGIKPDIELDGFSSEDFNKIFYGNYESDDYTIDRFIKEVVEYLNKQ